MTKNLLLELGSSRLQQHILPSQDAVVYAYSSNCNTHTEPFLGKMLHRNVLCMAIPTKFAFMTQSKIQFQNSRLFTHLPDVKYQSCSSEAKQHGGFDHAVKQGDIQVLTQNIMEQNTVQNIKKCKYFLQVLKFY